MIFFTPNLFIPGVAKCGTTTLHELLSQHPNISMSLRKEPHFWTDLKFPDFNQTDWNNYKALFPKNKKASYFGESSTGSLFFPEMFISRLKQYKTGPIKFIFILRNPIDRCYSHYWWCKGSGREKRPFLKAVEEDIKREVTYYYDWPNYYFQFGLYSKWLKPFINTFKHSNIKIITLEQLKNDPLKTINECYNFLDLAPVAQVSKTIANETTILKFSKFYNISRKISKGDFKFTKIFKYFLSQKTIDEIRYIMNEKLFRILKSNKKYAPLNITSRQKLKKIYTPEVKELERLLGRTFDEWSDFYI